MSATDAFGKHEVVTAAAIIQEMWADHILDHAATHTDPDVLTKAREAFDRIADFYQLVGVRF